MEYYAVGYVTASAKHFARTEMWYKGRLDEAGRARWGTWRVPAKSYCAYNPEKAKIFYGDKD